MRRFISTLFILAFAAAYGAQEAPVLSRVEFSSTPDGADVFIDGKLRGKTPFTIQDLKPLRTYSLRIAKENYEPYDEVFTPVEGPNSPKFAKLNPIKGILLVTSEPEGAEITLDGYSMGETPRLITSLNAKDQVSLTLKKVGFLESKVEVKFDGRRPLVRNVKLVLNSGVAEINSEPAGAEVVLNGIPRGTTPVKVSEIPNGRLSLVIRKEGYATISRDIAINAGDTQNLNFVLEALPGPLMLTSIPEGARFYINDEPCGKSPAHLKNLKPGLYRIRAEADGYTTLHRAVSVGNGETKNEEFRLETNLSNIEIRTCPAGASVEVDGKKYGTTKGPAGLADWSDALIVTGLKEGEHTVRIKRHGYAEAVEHPVLKASSTTPVKVRLKEVFTPDVRIVTYSESVDGILRESNASFVTIEVKRGVNRTIPKENIRAIEYLDSRK